MRARQNFTYVIEKLFPIPALFSFIQEKAGLSDSEMYQTFNMGQDFAIYLSARDVNQALKIIKKNKFVGINAGYLKKGPKQVIIESKNIVFDSKTLDLR
jgi:phosphoribosylformylglycinamidine cyclo-ligase